MKILKHFKILYACAVSFLLFVAAYFLVASNLKNDSLDKKSIDIVCTTTMITDAVRRIGGPYLQVTGLMGPGVDPHLYRARARTIEELSNADAIFYHGLHLEGKMADVLQALGKNKKTVAVADAISFEELISSDFEGIYDPHIWHDVSLWIKIVQFIAEQLSEIDNEHSDYYFQQMQEYIQELRDLDKSIRTKCNTLKIDERILVTAHDAFAYFGRTYGIEVVALQGMNTDAQISPNDVTRLAHFVIENKVKTIFFESSIPRRTMEAVREAIQAYSGTVSFGNELYSDALGDYDGPQGTYVSMIKYNVDTIMQGLQQEK